MAKLFSKTGYIGRKIFIVNYLYVQIIIVLLRGVWSLIGLGLLVFAPNILKQVPYRYVPDELIAIIISIIELLFFYSSVRRRVYDIIGNETQNKLWIYTAFYCIFSVLTLGYLREMYRFGSLDIDFRFLAFICVVSLLFLCCKKGVLSSNEPENKIYKFNWGAFIGTWIWGLLNNVKNTLIMPVLFFFGNGVLLYFSLICGLNGNEWAYKNTPNLPVEDFHKKQKKYTIAMIFTVPILTLFFIVLASIVVMYGNNYNYLKQKFEKYINIVSQNTISIDTERYEYFDGHYFFYINPKTWESMSYKDRQGLFMVSIFKVMADKNISTLDEIPSEIPANISFYDSTSDKFLLGCYISDEIGTSISHKSKELEKVIKQCLRY